MRQSLLVARQDLHSLDERAREEQKFQEEMTRLKEHKEHQKATDTMQLKTILVELDEEKSKTRQLESENSKLGEKMKELNSRLEVLTTQNQDLEIGDTFMKNEIKMLKTLNDERSTEIQQLQEMVNELQSRTKDRLNESSINMSFSMPENLGDVLATDFQSKVNELEELTEQLKDQNAQLAKQGEEMKITIENLENKVKGKEAMEEQIRQLEHNTADLVEQRDSLKEKTDKIQNEFELRENGYLTQLKEMEKLKETLDTKAYDLEQESARVTDFQLKVNELEELTEQLRTHNEELVKQGEERILAIEDLEQKAQGREAIEDQVKQLEYQNAELDKQRESFKASANKFQSELEVKENEYLKQLKEKDGIKDILASKSCEVEQLSAQVSEFQSKINELEDITEQFKNHNAELVAQDEEKTMAIQSLEKRAQDKEAIEDQAKQLEQHNAELVQQRESLKDTANKLQSELQIKESEYLKKLKEKDSIEEILESKVSELDQQRAHIKDFQSKVYELEGLTEQMKNHNAELVTQCEEKVKAIQNLEERAQGKEALENSVKQLELHNAELVQQKEILKESVDKFQSELEVTESEYLKQMKERDSMREILDGKVYELEQKSIQVSDFQSKVIELEEQTEQLKNHNAELVTHGAEKVKAIQNLEERARGKEDMEDQVNELKRHNAELLQEKKVLKESVDQFQSELGVRESEFLKQMKERDSMKEILESKVYELEQKSVQVSDFQSKVIELEEQTEQLKNHNAELVTQAAEKMQAIQNLEERAQGQEAMVDQVMQLENQNAELVEQKENLQADANKFQSELEMMKSGYLNQLKQKDSMKEVLESKVSELEQQRSQVMCRNENILQEKENVLQEKENLIVELKKILRDRDNDHEKEIEELKVAHEQSNKKMEAKHAEQRAQMKEKLQSKLKEAGNIMQTKYNEKLEQYAGEKDQEVSEIRKSESKFSKMAEELQKKYNASKAILTEKVTENKKLRAEVEELRKKLGRQDQPTKQKAVATPGPSNDVFKAPKLQAPKNTPGRSKPGRTQSDIQIKAPSRRPPLGTGNLFTMDDEQGEMFSNSYLSELKSGKCSMDNSGKMFSR